eukprot:6466613-Amphidinium_carterae.3
MRKLESLGNQIGIVSLSLQPCFATNGAAIEPSCPKPLFSHLDVSCWIAFSTGFAANKTSRAGA